MKQLISPRYMTPGLLGENVYDRYLGECRISNIDTFYKNIIIGISYK